jgi:invasion protein IalB
VTIASPDTGSTSLSATFGTRHKLDGAISLRIDQDNPILIPNPHCYASGCAGKFEIDREFIERLKRSQVITIEGTNSAQRKLSLSFSLAGLAAAYDGPGTEPKVFQETVSSEKMKELMKRSNEQKLPQYDE